MNGYVFFSDLKGFSKLSELELKVFFKEILPQLDNKISKFKAEASVWNTWGDALVAVFEDGEIACRFALTLRDFFKNNEYNGQPPLAIRIGGHFGQFELIEDPIINHNNAFGRNINTSARIEPVTRPDEIFVTEPLKHAVENFPKVIDVSFDTLGEIPLAKNFGNNNLFRLRKKSEKEHLIDRILKIDFSDALPEPKRIEDNEKREVEFLTSAPSKDELIQHLDDIQFEGKTGEYILEIIKLCKNWGLYSRALKYINFLYKNELPVGDLKIKPYRFFPELQKIQANCLTRLERYEEAANIIYGLWQMHIHDSDTLSMLAAQYKRRALINNGEIISSEDIDKSENSLIDRASKLYLEAFRLDINDYYPAINAAYLYKILGGIEKGKGTKLAQYICDVWQEDRGSDWWLDATLAEAELLQDDFEIAEQRFQEALEIHSPPKFERESTYQQISLYATIENLEEEVQPILKLLQA